MGCGCSAGSLGGPPSAFHGSYLLEERLGRGTYGQVWSCSHLESDDRFAVKILRLWRGPETLGKVSFMRQQLTSKEAKEKAKNEAALWARIGRHEHCVELHKVFMENMLCYLVMEPCVRSVVKALQDTWPCPIEEDVLRIVYHTLLALRHIHNRGIVHRDVKPDNILLGGADGTVAKLCDFGLALDLPNGGEALQEVAGTPPYMAPEMLRGALQTAKIDLWSLGVTAYVMLYGSFPYSPAKPGSIQSVKQVIVWGVPPPRYKPVSDLPTPSKLAERMAKLLLVRSPETREDAAGVLALAVGRELQQVAAAPLEVARRSAGQKVSFLPVVQAAQREMDFFTSEPSRDGALDRVLEQRRRMSEARRNTVSGAVGQARETDRPDGGGRLRRWSTGATVAALVRRGEAPPGQRRGSFFGRRSVLPEAPSADDAPAAAAATSKSEETGREAARAAAAGATKATAAAAGDESRRGPGHSSSFNLPRAIGQKHGASAGRSIKPKGAKATYMTLRRGSVPDMPMAPDEEDDTQPEVDPTAQSSDSRAPYRRWSTGATDTDQAPRRPFPEGHRDLPMASVMNSLSFLSRSSCSSIASVVPDPDAPVGGGAEALGDDDEGSQLAPTLLGRGFDGKHPTSASTACTPPAE